MPEISVTQRDTLARLLARYRTATALRDVELGRLQELAAILRELREMPLDASSTSPEAAELMSPPIARLRFDGFPTDLDPRVAVILARNAAELASDENLALVESELRRLVAPLDEVERASAAMTARLEEEESRYAALVALLDVFNAFIASGEST